MNDAIGNQAPSAQVTGKTEFEQPVFQKIVRRALAGVRGLRLEPLDSGNPLVRFRRRRPGLVMARAAGERLELKVPLQAEYGLRIPELAAEAQRAITTEARRVLGCAEVQVHLLLVGLYRNQEQI